MSSCRCVIKGVGGYLPSRVLHNDDLPESLNTSHQWIESRTGIAQRHVAEPHQFTSHLAIKAAESALSHAKLDAKHLEVIILATSTPDHIFPPTATAVQASLGAKNAIAFDMNVACSGFLFALMMADAYLKQAGLTYALVIGSETMTRLVDWEDRKTAILFGDGAGAVVLGAEPHSKRGILEATLFSDGRGYKELYVSGGPSSTGTVGHIVMNGQEVFRQAISHLEQATLALMTKTGHSLSEVDWVIPHQANKRILWTMAERLGLPLEKMIYTGEHHANTSAASIPLALWKAYEEKRIQENDLLLLQAFGAGFTWGTCLVRA